MLTLILFKYSFIGAFYVIMRIQSQLARGLLSTDEKKAKYSKEIEYFW